jgi:transmembrane sensor
MNTRSHEHHPARDAAAIEAAAVAWLCEREEGLAPERAAAFAAWCAADPRHRAAVAKVARGLALLHELPDARRAVEARLTPRREAPAGAARRGSFATWAWPVGAAAAMLVALAFWWLPVDRPPDAQILAATSTAPHRAKLGDGSVLNLNTGSRVEVRLGAHERRVTLAQGEAHFEVKADPARPFVVEAGGVAVRAVGTMFAVRLGREAVEVLVEEGRVAVAPAQPAPAPGAVATSAPPAPLVQAGERALVPRAEPTVAPRIARMDPPAMGAALHWHRRVALFNDTPLHEVIAQFNRRNAVQISLADAELAGRRFGGALALDQVEALLRLLTREGGVAVERRGETEIILRRAP